MIQDTINKRNREMNWRREYRSDLPCRKYPGKKNGCGIADSGNALHAMVQKVEQAAGSGNIWSGIPAPDIITGEAG